MAKSKSPKPFGEIIGLLIENKLVSEDQVKYAARIQSKLENPQTLLDIIKAEYALDDAQIRAAIRANRVFMPIGSLLKELGHISDADLEMAFNIQKEERPKRKIGEILVAHNLIDEKVMVEVLSLQLGFPYLDPAFEEIDGDIFNRVPLKWYEANRWIPVRREDEQIVVAFVDPLDRLDVEAVQRIFDEPVIAGIALESSIKTATLKMLGRAGSQQAATVDDDSIIGIANQIIISAIEHNASDIHVEPLKDRLRVRLRLDGVLTHHKDYPRDIIRPLTSRIKIMCAADISERRRHQGGRIYFDHAGTELDLRVSFYVTIHGEKIVLRLLNRQGALLQIEDIGMQPRVLERFKQDALERPSGVLLITGPTGSGKTTTVYSCINYLNDPQTSIITAEEPVEYIIDGISQCSINPKINLTFKETLRHMVRQDPDIIVIGEIRDNYSADTAVQSALTGHKVLTTFHTEDSIGGLIRLLNMEIEAFLISSTVVSVVAQRLVRRVCTHCAEPYQPSPLDLQRLGCNREYLAGAQFLKGRGCSQCRHSGYHGRIGIFELLVLDELVRNAILDRQTSHEIRSISIESSGLVTLMEDGLVKAADGFTSISELLRCLPRFQRLRPLAELRRLLGA
jgi:type IV pilus assembly protein PilB